MSIICIATVYPIIWKGVKVMLKKVFAVSMVLVLALGACWEGKEETVSRGLLSRDEIERMESLYFADTDAALEGMGLSKEDLENYGSSTSAGSYLLKAPRSIGGEYFRQAVLTSIAAPEGLFGMSFRATFDDQEEAESARDALRDVAAELYGEPVYPGTDRWKAGELTELSLHYFGSDDYSEDGAYRYIVDLEYSIPSVIDGRRLSGDEMAEMVREVQEKRKQ